MLKCLILTFSDQKTRGEIEASAAYRIPWVSGLRRVRKVRNRGYTLIVVVVVVVVDVVVAVVAGFATSIIVT